MEGYCSSFKYSYIVRKLKVLKLYCILFSFFSNEYNRNVFIFYNKYTSLGE